MALSIRKSLLSLYLRSSPSLTNPSSFFFSTLRATKPKSKSKSKISVFDYLVNQQQFSPDVAAKALSVAAVKNLKNPKNADSVLSYLTGVGFSRSQIETIVQKVPRVLSSDVDNVIKPKVEVFSDSGFKPKDMTEIITSDPWILTRSSVNRLAPSIEALKSVVGSIADVTTLLKKSAWFLKLDLNATMLPNVEYVRSLGLSHEKILRFMSSFPRFFLFKPELVKEFARKVEEMGFDRQSAMFVYAVRVVSSMSPERWDDKLKLLRELGFSEEDIVFAFKRQPMAFSTSDRKVKEVVEFLVSETHLDISSIVKAPQLLLCSIEHRIKPRLLVIKALQENNLLRGGQPPNMMNIYKMGHVPFSKKYVFPYCDKVKDLLRIAGGS
ncbi:Transcription termination factor MTERF9, chloroplastic [Linum grandiflorum]